MNNNYNNNRQHQHAHQQGANNNQLNPNPQDAANKLPYGFVSVGDARIKRDSRVDLGKDNPELYTGYINCSMYALNELCVGNSHKDLGNDRTAILPLMVDGKILISSHTLKGCIANFLAAHLKLPITRMNNHHYSFRPNNAPSGSQILTGAGVVEKIQGGVVTVKKFSENKFAFVQEDYNSKQDKVVEHGIRFTSKVYNDKKKIDVEAYKYIINKHIDKSISSTNIFTDSFIFYKYHDGIDGCGVLGGKAERPASHKSFGVRLFGRTEPSFDSNPYTISASTLQGYKDTVLMLSNDQEGHLNQHPMAKELSITDVKRNILTNSGLQTGDIIFFEYAAKSTEILTFGKHYRYRWAYSNDLRSFNKDYQPLDISSIKQGLTNSIEELFGYSYGDIPQKEKDGTRFDLLAKSAKVHFSFAEHVSGTGQLKTEKWLPRPGSPKPSSYEFYIRENYESLLSKEQLQEGLTTYGDPARKDFKQHPRLSGRKFYYATSKTPYNDNEIESGVTKTVKLENVLYPAPSSYPEFRFKVYFDNLKMEELQQLRFALCLGENVPPDPGEHIESQNLLCHQIGYGKNHGMGAVKIIIDTIEGVEQIHRYIKKDNSITLEPVEVENTLLVDNVSLFKIGEALRNYPIYDTAKIAAINKHNREHKPDNDSDGVGTYSWHTKLKNDDLRARRERRR